MGSALVDIVKVVCNSTGTGSITLGPAVNSFRGVEALVNNTTYSYSIQEDYGWEYGRCIYLSAGNQLIRTPINSSDGGAPINLAANAQIAFVALAEDLDAVTLSNAAIDAAASSEQSAAKAAISAATAIGAQFLYASTSEGLANTQSGEYFSVAQTGDTYSILYLNSSGTAVEINRISSESVVAGKANASAIGIDGADNDMGAFSGSTIPDGSTAKAALQALESAFEAPTPSDGRSMVLPTVSYAETVTISAATGMVFVGKFSVNSDGAPASYRRVSAQPPHAAAFRSTDRFMPDGSTDSVNGGWWELASAYITPEMLADRSCGYLVGTDGYASAPDDSDILNAAIKASIHLNIPLELRGKWYRHNSPLIAVPTRAVPYEGTTLTARDIEFWNRINAQSLRINAYGNAGLIAGSAMQYQLRVYNDYAITDSREPQWIKIDGLKMNGAGLVSDSNLYLNWSGNADIGSCGFSGAGRAIQVFGFGVFDIHHCDIRGEYFAIDVQAGGDATIQDNDIFVVRTGVNAAGNIKICRNIFTGTGFTSRGNSTRIGILINPVGTNSAGSFPYSYGMRIGQNEFNAIDTAVYGDATSSGFQAIHMVSIESNHIIADVNVQPDVALCDITFSRDVVISGNQIGRDVQVLSQAVPIRLTDCENIHIADCAATNVANSAIVLTRCKAVKAHDGSLTNVGCMANAIAYSEALQTAPWAATNASVITGTTYPVPTGTILCKNGATLQRVQDTVTNALHGVTQPRTVISGQSYTASAIVKSAEITKCKLVPYASTVGATFDLIAGTVTAQDAGCTGGIADLGDGTYRIWCTLNSAPGTTANPGIYLANSSGSITYAGAAGGLYAGAVGLVAGYNSTSYYGATGSSGSAQPAQIVLNDSDHINIHDNSSIVKFNMTFPPVFAAETGTSNYNIVKDNILPDASVMNPFYRVGANSYVVSWEKSSFRATKTAAQTVTTGVVTKITFDQTPLNRGMKFSSSRYTPGVGVITLSGSVRASGLVSGQAFEVIVEKNGTAIGGNGRLAEAADDSISFSICDESAPNDYYEVFLYAAGAGDKTISNDSRYTYFSGQNN